MHDIDCPYCGKGQEINHDDGYRYEEGKKHEQQCGYCDKYFTYTTLISFYYEPEKADCLNGEPHKLKKVFSSVRDIYPDWVKCEDCDYEYIGKPNKDVL
jgi:hypothetical protein